MTSRVLFARAPRLAAALIAAGLLLTPSARAETGDIVTTDGGPGRGPATSVAQHPEQVKVGGNSLYVTDAQSATVPPIDYQPSHIIRAIDLSTQNEQVVAGSDVVRGGFGGDGGPATEALISSAGAAVADSGGSVFIADAGNSRIRRVDAASGVITTVAGTGSAGFGGDGGQATAATLNSPTSLAFDSAGNMYIADSGNSRVRRVASSGVITTVAGTGTFGFSGDGGPATAAALSGPRDVGFDAAGNLYIADFYNGRIRRVSSVTGIITTAAGGGTSEDDGVPATSADLTYPQAIAADGVGNIFITRFGRVRRVDAASGLISTVAGGATAGYSGDGGPATAAQLLDVRGVSVDGSGNLYIGDTGNNRVRRVDAGTSVITTIAGNGTESFSGDGGPSKDARLRYPIDVTFDWSGNRYIADRGNVRVRKVSGSTGRISTLAGDGIEGFAGDGGPAASARLGHYFTVSTDAAGNVYLADSANQRIRRVDASSGVISTVAGSGVDGFSGDGGPATLAALSSPWAVVVDSAGNLYIADGGNHRIRMVEAGTGFIWTVAGTGNPPTSSRASLPAPLSRPTLPPSTSPSMQRTTSTS